MKFGLTVPTFTWPGLDRKMARLVTKDMAQRAETLGYDSITVWDHLLSAPGLYGGSWMDPLMVLSCVAGATGTIPIGTHILVVPLRHPVLLAKELATLDHMSEGRFFFGVGPGWNEPEFTAMGIPMKERGRRTDEVLGRGEAAAHRGERLVPGAGTGSSRTSPSSPGPRGTSRCGWPAARASPTPSRPTSRTW